MTAAPSLTAPELAPLHGRQRRAAVAFAEALIPGSATIPAADESTVARAHALVREFHPTIAAGWKVAQSTLSAAAIARTGRPFHALPSHEQEALLRRWERDPLLRIPLGIVALIYKFVHFDRPRVRETMSGRKLGMVSGLEQPRWLRQIHPAEEWLANEDVECEVVVVGTGAGGAVVGRELADRGLAVVFVEEGEHHRRDAFDGSSVRAHQRFYRGAISLGNVTTPVFMGKLVGGSTAVNGGTCFRTPPWVLERWCEELGTDDLAPERMQRHFDRVEGVLEVAPSERRHIGPIADIMTRGCDRLGWSHFAVRRNAPGCDGSGFCDFGCGTDARRGANVAYVPPALEKGALLFTGLRVDRVLLEGARAVGIEGTAKNGRTVRVRARAVVLAGGAIPTPLLLLKQGLANGSGQVGRNLTIHPSSGLSALFDEEIRGHSHIPQGYGCDHFLRDGMLLLAAQPDVNVAPVLFPFAGRRLMETLEQLDRIASFGLMIRDATANGRVWRDVGGLPAITYSVTREDVDRMHQAMIRTGEMCLAAGAKKFFPVSVGWPVLEGEREFDRFREAKLSPTDIVWTSYHPLGTCRMGKDPRRSVVGLDHEAHEVPGLYVVDGSTVPGAPGVNPQVTIMAMATRAAEGIAERVGAGEG